MPSLDKSKIKSTVDNIKPFSDESSSAPGSPQTQNIKSIEEYVNTVCQQIRWEKAHARVADELANHINDTRDAYLSQDHTEAEATVKAIADTGDAAIVGTQLDRVHRPKPQWSMLGITAVLAILGLVGYAYLDNGITAARSIFTGIGVVGLVAAYFADFTWLTKYPKTLLFAVAAFTQILSFALYIRGWGVWGSIHLGAGFTLSRTTLEAVILFFPLALAAIIFYTKGKGYRGLTISALAFILLALIAFGVSVPGVARFTVIGLAMFGVAIIKDWFGIKKFVAFMLTFGIGTVASMLSFALMSEWQRERINIFFNPSTAPYTRGFWPLITREIIRDAAWFGQSANENLILMFPLPPMLHHYNWRIPYYSALTVLIGYIGWIAFVVITGVIIFFIAKGILRCYRQKSSLGLLVSSTIMITFAVQAFEYIVYNLGFQMATPISLPLLFSGNAVLVANMVLVGFMLSVFRIGDVVIDEPADKGKKAGKLLNWGDGRLIINFKPRSGQRGFTDSAPE